MNFTNNWVVLLLVGSLLLTSCSSPEEKKLKFYNKGMELFTQEKFDKAGLEFRNALQIDPKYAQAYFMLGKLALEQENPRGGYGNFLKTVELNPDFHDAQIALAKLILATKDVEAARQKIEAVLDANQNHYDALLMRATLYLIEKNNAFAIDLLQNLIKHQDVNKEAYELLAMAYSSVNQKEKAEETLLKGAADFPDSISTLRLLARYYLKENQKEKALSFLEKIAVIDPDLIESRLEIAAIHLNSKEKGKALEVLLQASKMSPETEENWIKIANFLLSGSMLEEAESYLRKGISHNPSSFLVRFRLSDLLVSLNRIEEAIALNEECLTLTKDEKDPFISQTHTNLAMIHLKIGEIDKAINDVNKALESNPKSVDAHFVRGSLYLSEGKPEEAIGEFRVVQEEKPDFIPGRIRLTEAHMRNNQPQLAKDTVQQALKSYPNNLQLAQTLAKIYLIENDTDEAVKLYREMLEKDSDNQRLRADLGDIYVLSKQQDQALKMFMEIKKTEPMIPAGYIKVAQLHLAMGNSKKAIATLQEGMNFLPDSTTLMEQIVKTYLQIGEKQKAQAFCRAQIKKNPENPYPYNLLGSIEMQEKNFSGAEASFKKAVSLNQKWLTPLNNLAAVLLMQGKKEEALDRFEASLAANPRNPALYSVLGQLYGQTGDNAKVVALYEKGLENIPSDWSLINNYAYMLAQQAKSDAELQQALVMAKKALRLNPENPVVLDTVGWILFTLEDYPQANTYLEKAISKENIPAELYYHHGMLMYKTGQISEAILSLERAMAMDNQFQGRDDAEALLENLKKKG